MTQSIGAIRQILRKKIQTLFLISFAFGTTVAFQKAEASTMETRHLQIPPLVNNFLFTEFQTQWFTSQEKWDGFWKENSRINEVKVPELPVNWEKEAVLGIFWKSEDAVIRMPAYDSVEEIQVDGEDPTSLKLKINFLLNTPCFGIITDSSPTAFMAFEYSKLKYKSIEISTDTTQSTGCLGDDGFGEETLSPDPKDPGTN